MAPLGSNYFVFLIAALGVATADPAFAEPVVDNIYAAVQRQPSVKRIPSSTGEFAYYALEIENLCGPGSLTQAAMDWVDAATFPGYQRAVALSVTYAFPDSFPRLANVTIPLIAIANTGDRGVQNCAPITVRDVPRNQAATVRFDFSAKEAFRFLDASGVVASFGKVAGAVGGLAGYGGGVVVSGAATAVSFLAANTAPIKNLTDATNELLKLLDRDRRPRGSVKAIAETTGRVSYGSRRAEVFAVQKSYYDTLIKSRPGQPYWSIASDFTQVAQRDWNDVVRDVVNAYPAFWENMPRFCPALRNTLSAAAHSDPISIALALYYHAAANADSYNLATNRTCLSSQEFRQLSKRGWARPFENALSFQNVAWPEPGQQVAAQTIR